MYFNNFIYRLIIFYHVIIMRTLEWEDNKLKLIDQTKLPDELTYVYCSTYQEVIDAIKTMVVRGAPAIGVSAAFGMALAQIAGEDMEKVAVEMKNARPTAVNLMWAVDRVMKADNMLDEAMAMAGEDINTNLAIGEYGAELIDDGDTVLTYAGFGDLLLTATSEKSRNYSLGYMIGSGCDSEKIENYIKNTTIEGLYTLKSIRELVSDKDVDMPIINLIEEIIYHGKKPKELINFLVKKP